MLLGDIKSGSKEALFVASTIILSPFRAIQAVTQVLRRKQASSAVRGLTSCSRMDSFRIRLFVVKYFTLVMRPVTFTYNCMSVVLIISCFGGSVYCGCTASYFPRCTAFRSLAGLTGPTSTLRLFFCVHHDHHVDTRASCSPFGDITTSHNFKPELDPRHMSQHMSVCAST